MRNTTNDRNTTSSEVNDNEYISLSRKRFNKQRMELLQVTLNEEGLEDESIFTYTLEDMLYMGLREFIELSLLGGKEILALFIYLDPSTHMVDIRKIRYITTTHSELCKTIRENTDGDYILASIRHINESILNKSFMEVMEMFGIDVIPNEKG